MQTDGSKTFERGRSANMRPLDAGDQAPAFALPDPDDNVVSSAELLKEGPLIVTFYRGIWCPYCQEDLKDVAGAVAQIRACGASLVAIAHQTAPGSNGKFQQEHGLEFPILDDRRGEVAVAYRIRWSPEELVAAEERFGKLPGLNTETTWILPMQARYVIGRDGVIAYADINEDYRQHPDPRTILPLLRNMSLDPG
jgi:peroxiredoxin